MSAEPTDGDAHSPAHPDVAAGQPHTGTTRTAGAYPSLTVGLFAPALVGAWLTAQALGRPVVMLLAVLALQLWLVSGVGRLDTPAPRSSTAIGLVTAGLGSWAVFISDGQVGGLAPVIALGLGAALADQLFRRRRRRVTVSLVDTVAFVVLGGCAACLLATRQLPGGQEVLVVCLAAASSALVARWVGDRMAPRPQVLSDVAGSWTGVGLALTAGALVALSMASVFGGPLDAAAGWRTVMVGLVVAGTVVAAQLGVLLTAVDPTIPVAPRRGWDSAAVVMTVPFAVLGPVAWLVGRLVQT